MTDKRRPVPTVSFGSDDVEVKTIDDLNDERVRKEREFVHGPKDTSARGTLGTEKTDGSAAILRSEAPKIPQSKHLVPSKHSGTSGTYGAPVRRKGVVTHADGTESRRFVIYVPIPLSERVAVFAARSGRELSHIGAEALETYLRLQGQ